MWGFVTVINNTLLPHLRSVFDLDYTRTTLIDRIGYRKAMVAGLAIMAAGALMMVPAAAIPSYGVTLFALFVVASGITLL